MTQPSALAESIALAESLDAPTDYFRGVTVPPRIAPTQILCYTRTTAERLLASNRTDRDIHHRHVLILPLIAEGEVNVDTGTYILRSSQALLVFPFQFHHYSRVSAESILWLFVTFECRDDSPLGALRDRGPISLDASAVQHLRQLLVAYPDPDEHACIGLALELFLWHLIQVARREKSPGGSPGNPDRNPRQAILEAVNAWVMSRIHRGFLLGELAASLGYSESHLRALFRAETHHSLGQHIRRLRLLKGCQLLQETALGISEVAARCGFDSVYSFSRAFRRNFSTTPSAYRRKLASYRVSS